MRHARRELVHVNATANPTAQWAAQQVIEAFPYDTAPRYVIRDRDAIFGEAFQRRVRGMGIEQVLTAPRSPWQNPYVERLIGSIDDPLLQRMQPIPAAGRCPGRRPPIGRRLGGRICRELSQEFPAMSPCYAPV